MNSNGLAKYYNCLSPWERLTLIVSASARGDEVEHDRLARSAPELCFRVPTNEHGALRYRVKKEGPLSNAHDIDLGTLNDDVKGIEIVALRRYRIDLTSKFTPSFCPG